MTEQTEAVEMVECALSGTSIEADKAIQFTVKATNETKYIEAQTALLLALETPLLGVILEKVALNDEAFKEVTRIRQVAVAKNQGVQEGANAVIKKLKEAAVEGGVDLDELISKAFSNPEAASEKVEESTTTSN